MDLSHHHHPQLPALPSDSTPTIAPIHPARPRRPSSLPSSVGPDIRPYKRSANYIRTQTASPEVISNLIDSLSAISLSAHNHFENLPVTTGLSVSSPATPSLQTHFGRDTLAVPNGSNIIDSQLQDELYDDACEPPVIRTSKPPSGLSPLTAPKKKDKDNSLRSYMSRSGGSSASVHSAHSARSATSFGAISIEAGILRQVSTGSNRTSSESKRSLRAHRGLMYMSSRERLKAKDADRKRASSQGSEALTSSNESTRKPIPQHFVSEDTIKEETVVVAESSRAAQRNASGSSSSATSLRNNLALLGPEGGSPTEKGLIPQRASSLRHSGSPSRKGRRSHGRKGSRTDSYKTNTVPEEDENVDQDVSTKDKILKELEAEENEVAHRIRELKKQKMLRDRIAGKRPVGVNSVAAGASSSGVPVSPITTAENSPTSTVSSMSERRVQDPAKAHKVLGIVMHPAPPERRSSHVPEPTEIRETHEMQKSQGRHTRTRSLTVNDGDDITPLPINYKLAMQTLERAASTSSRAPSNASSKGTASSDTPPTRSKSLAVGGRSAVSRKSTSMTMGASTTHQPSTGGANGANASNERSHRSVSEEISIRHHSIAITPSPAATHSLQQRPMQKKKRWSHPDLPARAEKMHNDKVDAINAAVQSPPRPIIEERPSSVDSIDIDVDGYLNSQRLSQKIRHPQTGRVISFSEVGDPQGFAIFVCVGMGLTRYVMAFYDQLAASLKLRLITPDRPGIGGSQVDPNGTPLSWPGKFPPISFLLSY